LFWIPELIRLPLRVLFWSMRGMVQSFIIYVILISYQLHLF